MVLLITIPLVVQSIDSDITVTPSFGWHLDNLIEGIEDGLKVDFDCWCQKTVAELDIKHAERQQRLIDEIDSKNLPIPYAMEQRRIEKIDRAERQVSEDRIMGKNSSTGLDDVIAQLKVVGELNEIRILHSQLPLVKDSSDEEKRRFNERVNALSSWKEFCTGEFNVDQFDNTQGSWDALKNRCKTLAQWEDKFGFNAIRSVVNGGT